MHLALPPRAVALSVVAALSLGARAEVSASAVATAPARVIVALKADAPLLREQSMSLHQAAPAAAAAAQRRAERLAERAGVALTAGTAISERAQVVTANGIDASTLARRLAADPEVAYAAVDQRRRALRLPNDPLYARGPASGRGPEVGQWYLRAPTTDLVSAVNAEAAWDRATGSPAVVVAVVDTGVWAEHLDLAARLLPGYDMISDVATANDGDGRDADPSDPGDWITAADNGSGPFRNCGVDDSSWHGTQIAGIVGAAADDGQGMAGTAWGVKILPVRVLGKCGGYDSDIQAGMRWAAGLYVPGAPLNPNRAQVINLSLGGSGTCDAGTGYPQLIAELQAAGTTVVAAAGNSAGRAAGLPSNCPGVIAVAGLRHAGSKVGFSDLGEAIAISAPAGNCINAGADQPCLYPILSSTNSGKQRPDAGGSAWTDSYDFSVGTSFAAPIVAGTTALMLSVRPQLLPDELRRLVQASARPFPSSGAGNDENGQPVPMCHAPDNSDQLQCYCSVGLCGAGMLDAAAAVAAAQAVPLARMGPDPESPVAGESFRLSAAASAAGQGRSLVSYEWSLVDDAAGAVVFSGATHGVDVELTAQAAATVVVRLQVTDDAGQSASVQRSLVIAAAPLPPPSSGGGASSVLWVALLGLGVAALLLERRRAGPALRRCRPRAALRPPRSYALARWWIALTALTALCSAAAAGAEAGSAAWAEAGTSARGLVVRLRGAPPHESLLARGSEVQPREHAAALAADDAARWRRVLGYAGMSGSSGKREPRMRAVGHDQQLLDFERPLSRSEVAQLRDRLLQRPEVEWVEANVRERRLQAAPPSDPLYAQQWWLQPVDGSNANAITDRLRGVAGFQSAWLRANFAPAVVAVLDTGMTAHPDLDPSRVLPGYDFVSVIEYANDGSGRDSDPSDPGDWVSASDGLAGCAIEDSSWHGTIIAGMLAATTGNGLGGAGIHGGARILPVRVAGKCGAELADIVDGMRWAAGLAVTGAPLNPNPARVINISFGGSAACGPAYQTAIDELRARGVVVVAAAGNDWAGPSRPANCDGVVGVVGLNRDGFKSNYSNFGSPLTASGIAAVSGDDSDGAWGAALADSGLATLTNLGRSVPAAAGYARLYGTSFAAPQVAGTIALMLSLNPALTYEQIVEGLRVSARPHVTSPKIGLCSDANPGRCICTMATCGAGILDAEQALIFASMPDHYVAPVRQAAVIDTPELDQALALAAQDRPGNGSPAAAGGDSTGGGGGGAFGAFWLMALFAAAVALHAVRPRPRRR